MTENLSYIMDFGHVIRVENCVISDVTSNKREYWAPELYWDENDYYFFGYHDTWILMKGYSGQSSSAGRYDGPIMHPSEYIGGRMADDILATDGYYAALACDDLGDPDNPAGWAVAYRPL